MSSRRARPDSQNKRAQAARDLIQTHLPSDLVSALDLDSLELQKDSFIDEELRESYSDLLYSVQLAEHDGQRGPKWVRLTCPNSCRRFWVCL
ncbi:MAG: Rpn family recombination-promoting nuclease/putative transposase [Pirellula sp.]